MKDIKIHDAKPPRKDDVKVEKTEDDEFESVEEKKRD
jgi:hypothetical protein